MRLRKLFEHPEIIFVMLAGFFGVAAAFLLPVLETPDEDQHFQVAYAVFSANKHVDTDLVITGGMIKPDIKQGLYDERFTRRTSAAHDGVAINTDLKVYDGKTKSSVFDITRLPQAIGILIGRLIYPSLGVMIVMGRLVNLAVFLVAVYFIIKKVRYGKWLFVFLATLPMMVHQAATLSYDGINLVAIFAWIAYVITMFVQKTPLTKRQAIFGLLLGVLLLLTKPNNILLLCLAFVIPKERLVKSALIIKLQKSRWWRTIAYALLALFVIGVCIGMYVMSLKVLAGHSFDPIKLGMVLANTYLMGGQQLVDMATIGIVGQFGIFYYHLPIWGVVTALIVFVFLGLSEKIPGVSKRFALISGSLFFISIILISTAMYYGWAMLPARQGLDAKIADGIQGRYFTPLLLLLFPLFAYLQSLYSITLKNKYVLPVLVILVNGGLLSLFVVQTWRFFWK